MAGDADGEQMTYRIRVLGRLDHRWSDWFSGWAIRVTGDPPVITTLVGDADQTALRGVLTKLWDLNLTLVSVTPYRASELKPEEVDDDD